jgi:hypothetical protein
MIRVLLFTPLNDEQIPSETNSVNSVEVSGVQYMALYYRHLPIPESLDPANILEIYDSEQQVDNYGN